MNYPACPATPSTRWPGASSAGFGAMLSFELKDGSQAAVERLLLAPALVHPGREPGRAWRAWWPTRPA